MKSTLNILLLIAVLLMTLSCGILDRLKGDSDESIDSTESSENTEDSDISQQDGFEIEEADDEEDLESALESDDKKIKGNKAFTVRFRKGKTSRSYKSIVAGGFKHTYKFGASRGQTVTAKIRSGDGKAYFKVFDFIGKRISRSEVGDKTFTDLVPETGNYKVEIRTPSEKSTYTVTFTASALPKDEKEEPPTGGSGGKTRSVKFSKGRTSASYRGAVVRGDRDTYVLGAKGGQQMSVNISSLENNAVFQIRGPKGYLRGAGPGSNKRSWSGQLPADGKYRVIVGGTRGNATYNITFSIR